MGVIYPYALWTSQALSTKSLFEFCKIGNKSDNILNPTGSLSCTVLIFLYKC